MLKRIVPVLIVLSATSCAFFRVDKLNDQPEARIPLNDESGVKFQNQSGIVHEIPARVAETDDWVVISEPSRKSVKIFNDSKLLTEIISLEEKADPEKLPASAAGELKTNSYLKIPGRTIAGQNEDFFVESYNNVKAGRNKSDSGAGFYKILQFNLRGNFIRLIGREGRPELPFENILWMDVDSENRLWVLYRFLGNLKLDAYREGRLDYSIKQQNCESLMLENIEKEDNELLNCEFMYPFFDAERILLTARVDRVPDSDKEVTTFRYRVVKVLNTENAEVETVFSRLNDPEDFPYLPYDNNNFLVWQTEDYDTLKFSIYNLEGNLQNNLQIKLTGRHNRYRTTYYSLKGKFYSIKVDSDFFHLLNWR